MVGESGHGEGSGEELHPLAEVRDAGHGLGVLQQKGLEAGQVPCQRTKEPRQRVQRSASTLRGRVSKRYQHIINEGLNKDDYRYVRRRKSVPGTLIRTVLSPQLENKC